MTQHNARCLCGAIEVKVQSLDGEAGACHCSMCRRWGGGPLMTIESKSDIAIVDEHQQLGVFDSSEWAERGFCKQCGTHLFYRLKGQSHYYFPAGLFAEQSPTFSHQVFIDEKPAWYAFANNTKDLTGAQIFAMFNDS